MLVTEEIKKGNIAVFEKVFREFYAPLTLYVTGILKDKDIAEEIVQDFFYNFWKNREQLDVHTSLKSYFFQSVRNRALKYIRHENVKQKYADMVFDSALDQVSSSGMSVYELKELENRINQVLDKLPPVCSRIFRMSRFEGLKYKEIADRLSISVKTVEANMSKALSEFRQHLGAYTSP
jgi:RNA polymerase sigma-70 factor, ECF subfamily